MYAAVVVPELWKYTAYICSYKYLHNGFYMLIYANEYFHSSDDASKWQYNLYYYSNHILRSKNWTSTLQPDQLLGTDIPNFTFYAVH